MEYGKTDIRKLRHSATQDHEGEFLWFDGNIALRHYIGPCAGEGVEIVINPDGFDPYHDSHVLDDKEELKSFIDVLQIIHDKMP